jgi:hypothetical protein
MRSAWTVGWPPFAVLAVHFGLAATFGHHRALDPFFHFLGGVAGATALWRVLDLLPAPIRCVLPSDRRFAVAIAMLAVVVCWELAEFTSDRVYDTHVQRGPLDTWSDIGLGLLGAAVVLAVTPAVESRRSDRT